MLLRTEAFPVFLSFLKMSQGHVIDIMTYNSYSYSITVYESKRQGARIFYCHVNLLKS